MTILCGTDFSEPASAAADAAAELASARGEDLVLFHALDYAGAGEAVGSALIDAERERAAARLGEEAVRVAAVGVRVETEVGAGESDAELVSVARRRGAGLIVVGALGRRGGALWRVGSTADRVAQTSNVPVMIARGAPELAAWRRGERELRVLVGVDATDSSDAAVRWIAELERGGRCSVVCGHVYWPPDLMAKLGVEGGLPLGSQHAGAEQELAAGLRERIGSLRGAGSFDLRLLGGLGRTADHLVGMIESERADLVVVGVKASSALARFWHGSVSRDVIHLAPVSVVCVPADAPVSSQGRDS